MTSTNDKRRFGVFAIDHRDSLRAFVRPDDPDSLTAQEITDLKDQMVRAIAPDATGVMLEPEYSIPQLIDSGAKPATIGFTAALEAQGYLGDPEKGPTELLDGWSVEQAKASGASCANCCCRTAPTGPWPRRRNRSAATSSPSATGSVSRSCSNRSSTNSTTRRCGPSSCLKRLDGLLRSAPTC